MRLNALAGSSFHTFAFPRVRASGVSPCKVTHRRSKRLSSRQLIPSLVFSHQTYRSTSVIYGGRSKGSVRAEVNRKASKQPRKRWRSGGSRRDEAEVQVVDRARAFADGHIPLLKPLVAGIAAGLLLESADKLAHSALLLTLALGEYLLGVVGPFDFDVAALLDAANVSSILPFLVKHWKIMMIHAVSFTLPFYIYEELQVQAERVTGRQGLAALITGRLDASPLNDKINTAIANPARPAGFLAMSTPLQGVSFSVSGFLFTYYCGVIEVLMESGHLKVGQTELVGASGGGIITALVCMGVDTDTIVRAQKRMYAKLAADDELEVQHVLYAMLDEILPRDAVQRMNRNPSRVAITRLWPPPFPVLVSEFTSRDDLIGALVTGCYGGGGFTGNDPYRRWRGSPCMDGGATNLLPPLEYKSDRPVCDTSARSAPPATITVSAFPAKFQRVCFQDSAVGGIYPDIGEEWEWDEAWIFMLKGIGRKQPGGFEQALEDLDMLRDLGRASASTWVRAQLQARTAPPPKPDQKAPTRGTRPSLSNKSVPGRGRRNMEGTTAPQTLRGIAGLKQSLYNRSAKDDERGTKGKVGPLPTRGAVVRNNIEPRRMGGSRNRRRKGSN